MIARVSRIVGLIVESQGRAVGRLVEPLNRLSRAAVRRLIRRRARVAYVALAAFPAALAAVPLSIIVAGAIALGDNSFEGVLALINWALGLVLALLQGYLMVTRALRRKWMR